MESLYFIAIVPPEPVFSEVHELKLAVAEKFNSHHALKSPPHITLHMPFKWKDKKFSELRAVMKEINSLLEPFEVKISGFDFFEPRVVFVNVMESEKLNDLRTSVVTLCRRTLKLDNANYKNQPFHPHMTIGFRDLKKPDFYLARDFYAGQSYERKFPVSEVSLLKQDGKGWELLSFEE